MLHNDIAGRDEQMRKRRQVAPASMIKRQRLSRGLDGRIAANGLRHGQRRRQRELAKQPVLAALGNALLQGAQRLSGQRHRGRGRLQRLALLQMHVHGPQVVRVGLTNRSHGIIYKKKQRGSGSAHGTPAALQALLRGVVFQFAVQPELALTFELAVLVDRAPQIANVACPRAAARPAVKWE